MSVRAILGSTIMIMTILSITSAPIGLAQPTEFLTYKNSRHGVSIQYPSDWTFAKKNPVDRNIIATFRLPFEDNPKLFHADFRIVVEDSKKTNLAGLVMTRFAILSNIICLNFKPLESKPSNLTGFYPAHQLIFSASYYNITI
jgi:hypothetical protein